jgi:hypothetical protein
MDSCSHCFPSTSYRTGRFPIRHNSAGHAILDNTGHDRRNSTSKRFQHDIPKRIGVRWEYKKIHVRISLSQLFASQDSGERGAQHVFAQPRFLGSMSDNPIIQKEHATWQLLEK